MYFLNVFVFWMERIGRYNTVIGGCCRWKSCLGLLGRPLLAFLEFSQLLRSQTVRSRYDQIVCKGVWFILGHFKYYERRQAYGK